MKSTAMVPTVVAVLLFLLSVVAVASLGGVDASKAATSTVNAPCGPIVGTLTEEARVFRGIPYAKPPTGSLRWQKSEPAPAFQQPFPAMHDAAGCPQDCKLPPHTCPPTQSEDCLFMNIFTPHPDALTADEADTGVPVMVFIHGGNFKQGYAGGLLYDGTRFANVTKVISVVIQYRLGVLGFLYTQSTGTGNDITGNFGMWDQQLALQWVQLNIGAFGGDPDRVMVFGQSAGAMSVSVQMSSPSFKGLFSSALMESNPMGIPYRTPPTWPAAVTALAKNLGCPTTGAVDACLQKQSVADIISAQVTVEKDIGADPGKLLQVFLPWTPTANTPLLPGMPFHLFQANQVASTVPYAIGTVQNEGLLFVYEAFLKPVSKLEFDVLLDIIFGFGNAAKIAKQYPLPSNQTSDARPLLSKIATMALFVCPTRNATLSMSKAGNDAYLYHFDHIMSFSAAAWGANFTQCDDKVCHGEELVFVWHSNGTKYGFDFSPAEDAMSDAMESYWSSMAATGAPGSAEGGITWPMYKTATQESLLIQTPRNAVQSKAYASECDFWDSLDYTWV